MVQSIFLRLLPCMRVLRIHHELLNFTSRQYVNFSPHVLDFRILSKSLDVNLKLRPLLSSSPILTIDHRTVKRGIPSSKKTKGPRVVLTNQEMVKVIPIEEYDALLFGVISKLKTEYNINLSLRTGTGIESLPIELEGQMYPLKEIGQIARKASNVVVINLSAIPDALKPVNTALTSSGMDLSVQQEGSTLIVHLPKMTREHRENLAKNARSLFVKAKADIQEIQKSFIAAAKDQASGGISVDDIQDVSENLKYRADEAIKKCEEMCKTKTTELLE
ncbi:mitochondrial ribosome recycling factor 1 [Brevipalpus obovatus]|uniref:mitochondrial ribosome recycling factor 1 n=1 Tax=Brevipalpus obovatus TaxID=246614 RepID=UPI003D9F0E46